MLTSKGKSHRKLKTTRAVTDAINSLQEERISSIDESLRRARQLHGLGAMAQVMRALIIRARNGKITQTDLDSITPPKMKSQLPHGTDGIYEYIKTTFSLLEPLIQSLYRENKRLSRRLVEAEAALGSKRSSSEVVGLDEPYQTLRIDAVASFLGKWGIQDDEEEVLTEDDDNGDNGLNAS